MVRVDYDQKNLTHEEKLHLSTNFVHDVFTMRGNKITDDFGMLSLFKSSLLKFPHITISPCMPCYHQQKQWLPSNIQLTFSPQISEAKLSENI